MITLHKAGIYRLIETKHHTKILYLDDDTYAWAEPVNIGEILVTSHNIHKADCVLGTGVYHLYEAYEEPTLSDQQHLELEVGNNTWQGYLLPTGLPNDVKKRSRIIPTRELITGNPLYADRDSLKSVMAGA